MDGKLIQVLYHTVQNYNILPLTSRCNVRCVFCSHRQNPPGVRALAIPPLSVELVEDLLDYLDGHRKIVIGESASLIMEGEPFTHPYFWECLRLIRKRFPLTLIQLTTNGSYLDEQAVRKLAVFEPLEINLSLNIAGISERFNLMGDRQAEISCRSPQVLAKYGVKYHGSIVAMPQITGWESLYETIKYLSENNAQTIRVFKPGFTKFASPELQIKEELMVELAEKISAWRKGMCPISLEPPVLGDLEAWVLGVIKGSPAFQAGIKAGDKILQINGEPPFSRVEAFSLLKKKGEHKVLIEREGERKVFTIEVKGDWSGLVFDYDIALKEVEVVKEEIRKKHAQRPLILASEFGYRVLETALADSPAKILPVKNEFFGGNIQSAGLLVVQDMVKALVSFKKTNPEPDLVLIPAIAFDFQGRDLTGQGSWELEKEVACPVRLL